MGKLEKIDTKVLPYLRPRPLYWPHDYTCREYFSSVIPKRYVDDGLYENEFSPDLEWIIHKNEGILKKQRDEVSPVFSETKEDRIQAAQDALADIQDFNWQGKLDRRAAAVDAGNCSAEYVGNCKDICYGQGVGGECSRCAGQVVKLSGVTRPVRNCEIQY